MITYYNATIERYISYLQAPFMIKYFLNLVSLVRINIEYAFKEVFKAVTDKVRKNILT